MKWLIVAIALFFQVGYAAAFEPPDGFRGIKWATNIAAVSQDMVINEDNGDAKAYTRKNEKMNIGEAHLDNIRYGFYKGQFYAVVIDFHGLVNFSNLKQTLFEKYGAGSQPNQFIKTYLWGSARASVAFLLTYSDVSEKGSLIYQQNAIYQQKLEDSKAKSRDAGKDL